MPHLDRRIDAPADPKPDAAGTVKDGPSGNPPVAPAHEADVLADTPGDRQSDVVTREPKRPA